MLDNILYPDIYGPILDIAVSNSGSATNVLYKDTKGFMQHIEQIHTGEATSVLYPEEVLEIVTLICDNIKTYSRSRVVNR